VEVIGIAASPALASVRSRWKKLVPPDVADRVIPK
jgi:hypothetical protein